MIILPFDDLYCHFKAGIITSVGKLVSEFGWSGAVPLGRPSAGLGVSGVCHSNRFHRWTSPEPLSGRPCRVQS